MFLLGRNANVLSRKAVYTWEPKTIMSRYLLLVTILYVTSEHLLQRINQQKVLQKNMQ